MVKIDDLLQTKATRQNVLPLLQGTATLGTSSRTKSKASGGFFRIFSSGIGWTTRRLCCFRERLQEKGSIWKKSMVVFGFLFIHFSSSPQPKNKYLSCCAKVLKSQTLNQIQLPPACQTVWGGLILHEDL